MRGLMYDRIAKFFSKIRKYFGGLECQRISRSTAKKK